MKKYTLYDIYVDLELSKYFWSTVCDDMLTEKVQWENTSEFWKSISLVTRDDFIALRCVRIVLFSWPSIRNINLRLIREGRLKEQNFPGRV